MCLLYRVLLLQDPVQLIPHSAMGHSGILLHAKPYLPSIHPGKPHVYKQHSVQSGFPSEVATAEAQQWLLVLSCCSYLSLQIRGNLSEAYKAPCFAAINAPKYCLQSYCGIWPTVFNSLISVSVESQLLRSAFKVAADLKIISYKNSTSPLWRKKIHATESLLLTSNLHVKVNRFLMVNINQLTLRLNILIPRWSIMNA